MSSRQSFAIGNCRAVSIAPAKFERGSIRPPGSKSLTNRALVCAALADGTSQLTGVLDSEDTRVMVEAWRSLGIKIEQSNSNAPLQLSNGESEFDSMTVYGLAGHVPVSNADIFLANSGTSFRFLTAALSACNGDFVLDGVARMRERPIGDLIRALKQLGADVRSTNVDRPECPPVRIMAQGLAGGQATVAGSISSQYLSALMLAAPMAHSDVTIHVEGKLVSVPYVAMTARVMEAFGARVSGPETGPIAIRAMSKYRSTNYEIEPDASAASYFWAAAAIHSSEVCVQGLTGKSLQGDIRFCELLREMGCDVDYRDSEIVVRGGGKLRGIRTNMSDISDTVQTLAAVALFAESPTTVVGVAHNRHKETDRIADLARELRKFGATVDELDDGLKIIPPVTIQPAEIATYNDHRMAMSLALVGTRVPGVFIQNPQCTAKTYPGYWADLQRLVGCEIGCVD